MRFLARLAASVAVIVRCARIGKRHPSLAGLIATMPLMSLIVLFWLRLENPGDDALLRGCTQGALWGIVPSILFFAAAWLSLRGGIPLSLALASAFAAWPAGAMAHQRVLR
ncbi:MAG: DUF3147 family protein [Candidatus Aureabacteria bacterium]|nr:DUF3147 family protein [Candidatus Auribacterota bacterium]HOE27659.1 DUF3147 family protein [bacterium]HQM51950.1 DUF3147 family protein [bacterium]